MFSQNVGSRSVECHHIYTILSRNWYCKFNLQEYYCVIIVRTFVRVIFTRKRKVYNSEMLMSREPCCPSPSHARRSVQSSRVAKGLTQRPSHWGIEHQEERQECCLSWVLTLHKTPQGKRNNWQDTEDDDNYTKRVLSRLSHPIFHSCIPERALAVFLALRTLLTGCLMKQARAMYQLRIDSPPRPCTVCPRGCKADYALKGFACTSKFLDTLWTLRRRGHSPKATWAHKPCSQPSLQSPGSSSLIWSGMWIWVRTTCAAVLALSRQLSH